MAASVWACLILLCVVNVRSGLLPAPTGLLNLDLNGPNGGLLSALGGVIYTTLDAVDSLGQGLLGKLTAQSDKHGIDPSKAIIYPEEPWKVNSSYAAYQRDAYKILKNEGRLITYAEWINKIHGDSGSVYHYDSLIKYPHEEQNSDAHIANNQYTNGAKLGQQTSLNQEFAVGNDGAKGGPVSNADGIIHLPNYETVKDPLQNVLTLQNKPYTATSRTDNTVSSLSGVQQPNINGAYVVLSSGSNLGNQGTGLPNRPLFYKDNQGYLYEIIQANVNEVNQPIQPSPLKTQVYTLMNLNQNQGSKPVSYIVTNPIQIVTPRVESNPNVYTSQQIQNPDVNRVANYVTTPNYVSYGKTVTENDLKVQGVVNSPHSIEYGNTKEDTEVAEEAKEPSLKVDGDKASDV